MAEHSLVVAVIPTWNRKADLLETLKSLFESDYPNLRVIVVDNGSIDGSAQAVREAYPGVDVIPLDSNTGAAFASNRGIETALEKRADYILRMDSDITIDPKMISELVCFMQDHPKVGLSFPKIYRYDNPEIIWFTGARKHHFLITGKAFHFNIKDVGQIDPMRVDYAAFATALIRKELIEKIGLLDETFFVYSEDYDYSARMTQAGYTQWLVPSAVARHKIGQEKMGKFGTYHYNRGKIVFYRKHAHGFHLTLLILYCFAYSFYRAWFHRLHEPLDAALSGILNGLKLEIKKS